jgi:HSP20 family protein
MTMGKSSITRHNERESGRRRADWLERPGWAAWLDWPGLDLLRDGDKMLRIEEYRDGDTLVVRSEMPGIDPDKDVEIDLRDHMLEIRAERREEQTEEHKGTRRSEFRYGSFFRAIPLPMEAKEGDVQATYTDGVLEVRVPCAPSFDEKPHRIPIARN